jgi:lipid-binding SYLF domain-containing protein
MTRSLHWAKETTFTSDDILATHRPQWKLTKIGADASAAAGPVGRDAGADTDWKMKAQLLTYSRSRGLFAGIDLSGSVVTQDKDETRIMYGKFVPFDDILAGKARCTGMSHPFLSAVSK